MFKFWLGLTPEGVNAIFFEKDQVVSTVEYTESTEGLTPEALFEFSVLKLKESGLIDKDVPIIMTAVQVA